MGMKINKICFGFLGIYNLVKEDRKYKWYKLML